MARGRRVLTRMFPDSAHVQHFKKYRQEYVESVRELMALTGPRQSGGLISQPSVVVQLTLGEGTGSDKSKVGLTEGGPHGTEGMSSPRAGSLEREQGEAAGAGEAGGGGGRAAASWSAADLLDLEALLQAACMV